MAFFKCSGGSNPTGNATEGDVLATKTFSNADGTDKVGTMPNRGAVSISLDASTTSYTIPAGYHNGSGTVSITTQTKSATPSTSAQTISPDSGKLLSSVTISAVSTQEKTVTSSRSAQTVTPDSGKYLTKVTINALAPTGTYTASSRGASLDMGATSNYRYVNTNSVPNTNSGTYTFASGDTGGTKDLGATNTYRYVNAANVYAKGKADADPATVLANKWAVFNVSNTYPDSGNTVQIYFPQKFYGKYIKSISYKAERDKANTGYNDAFTLNYLTHGTDTRAYINFNFASQSAKNLQGTFTYSADSTGYLIGDYVRINIGNSGSRGNIWIDYLIIEFY